MNAFVSHLKNYAGHLIGYVVAAATIVAAVDPTKLSPTGAAIVAGAGTVVALANHSYKAGAASAVLQAAVTALEASAGPAKLAVAALAVGLLGFGMHGCATVQKAATVVTSPQAQPYIQAGALAAVTVAEAHGIAAVQINAVAKKALAADQGAGASLAAVKAVLDVELAKLNLPAGDLLAITIVETEFNAYVQSNIGQDPTLTKAQAAAADIFQAVIAATGG